MLAALLSWPAATIQLCRRVLVYTVQSLVAASLVLSIAYSCGWLHRLLWYILETEATKLLNGTPVTIGSFHVDLWRGRLWASNVIIHAPQRSAWKWESPVFARLGKVYVEANTLHILLFEWFFRETVPLEIPLCHVQDVQVFVERKSHIFNFYLLDPLNIVPHPADLDDEAPPHATLPAAGDGDPPADAAETSVPTMKSHPDDWELTNSSVEGSLEQEAAQKMVDEMMRAVQSMYVFVLIR